MPELHSDIRYIKGVGEQRAKSLARLGIHTLGDLLNYFPRSYEDRTVERPIAEVLPEETACIHAMVATEPRLTHVRRGMDLVKLRIVDDSGSAELTYFNQSYVRDQLVKGETYVFYGKMGGSLLRKTMANPVYERADRAGVTTGRILPIYRLTHGISNKLLITAEESALEACGDMLPELLPGRITARYALPKAGYAYRNVHFPPDRETLAVCEKAEDLFQKGEDLWLLSDIGDEGRLGLCAKSCGSLFVDAPDWLTGELSRHPKRLVKEGRDLYVEQINSSGRVYVFGCGHVAQELVPVLSHVGFRCVALDDRPEFARKELFPTAEEVLLIDFTRISDFITVGAEDYACVMTRGHAFDAVVQAQMLKTPACYIGVIGSRHKKAGVFQRLREEYGFTDEDFARVTTPIGLSIKAETPAEIAISIAGQMIELRATRNEV